MGLASWYALQWHLDGARSLKTYIDQVFPATTTTGEYEVLNPPSGYPALSVSNLDLVTVKAFSTSTCIDME